LLYNLDLLRLKRIPNRSITVVVSITMPVKTYTKEQLAKRLPTVKPMIVRAFDLESEKKVSKDMIALLKTLIATHTLVKLTTDDIEVLIGGTFKTQWEEGEDARTAEKSARKAEATAKAQATRAAKKKTE